MTVGPLPADAPFQIADQNGNVRYSGGKGKPVIRISGFPQVTSVHMTKGQHDTMANYVNKIAKIAGASHIPQDDYHKKSDTDLVTFYMLAINLDVNKVKGGQFIPGEGPQAPGYNLVNNGLSTIGDLISALLNPATWVRIAEVVIGLVLVGVGFAKMSTSTGDTLRKIPVYGKAIS